MHLRCGAGDESDDILMDGEKNECTRMLENMKPE